MKKKYLLALVAVLIISAAAFVFSNKQPKSITGQIKSKGTYTLESAKVVVEDPSIGKWGFGVNGTSICYIDSTGSSLMKYDLVSGEKDVLKKLPSSIEAANIQNNGASCLYQTIDGQNVSTYLYGTNGIEELKGYQRGILENDGLYILQDEQDFVVIDGSGNKVKNIPNKEGKIFAIAPTKEETFLISDYDFELRKGRVVSEQNINNQIAPAENAVTINALGSGFLLITQQESTFTANLFSGNLKTLELSGIDSDLIKPIPNGYLVVTKDNAESTEKVSNGLVLIKSDGSYQTVIHSIESSEEQFSINSIGYAKGTVYFSNGDKIMSLKVDF